MIAWKKEVNWKFDHLEKRLQTGKCNHLGKRLLTGICDHLGKDHELGRMITWEKIMNWDAHLGKDTVQLELEDSHLW